MGVSVVIVCCVYQIGFIFENLFEFHRALGLYGLGHIAPDPVSIREPEP